MLGGKLHHRQGIVHSQIGPLIIVGLLGRRGLSLDDLKVWDRTQLRPEGGTVEPLRAWLVDPDKGNITEGLANLLLGHEATVKRRALETLGHRPKLLDKLGRKFKPG
jgi:hypothetical protein